MTQPAQQPPAGPPQPQPTPPQGQAGQPPPAAPPAPPATPPPQQPPQPGQPPTAWPYGTPAPPAPPQQPPSTPPGWMPPPAPGQPPTPPPYLPPWPHPYGQPSWPPPYGTPAPPGPYPPASPTGQPAGQPAGDGDPGDQGQGGYDLSRLPKAARDEIERLRARDRDRDVQLRAAGVSQHAIALAGQHGVNPQALIGSTAWQQAAAQLDPNAPDYAQRLAWTVQAIAQANPWMTAQPAPPVPPPPPGQSGGDHPGGTGQGTPITEQQLAQMSPDEIAKAYTEGKLKHLM